MSIINALNLGSSSTVFNPSMAKSTDKVIMDDSSSSSPSVIIVAASLGAVLFVAFIILIAVIILRRKKRQGNGRVSKRCKDEIMITISHVKKKNCHDMRI